jgi:Calcineurin-like phosphoesterase
MRAILSSITLLLLVVAPLLAQSPASGARIVAVGDIHGAYTEFTSILKRTGLVDEQLKWAGGRTTLAQTGDYTDRGTDVRKVMDLLMQIERDAKSGGGQVVALLGNHEVMNLIGDWRDVTPEICATFATPKSEERREESWKQYERLKQGRADLPVPPVYQLTRDQWMQALPPGCLEYREAMGPSGTYGRWLRQKDIAAEIGGTLFMHAGINPARPAPKSIAEVNERARAEIRRVDTFRQRLVSQKLAVPSFNLQQILDVAVTELKKATEALAKAKAEKADPPDLDLPLLKEAQDFMEIAGWSLIDPEGPLWFRGYAQWDEATTAPQVNALLDQLKLTRIAVGHTPTADRKILARYQGRVILMDTGMLRAVYEGAPSALEINGSTLKAIYLEGEQPLSQ